MENAVKKPWKDYSKKEPLVIDLMQSKVPPQAPELEEAVLGAMMIDQKGLDEAFLILKTSDAFFVEKNKHIFEAISELYAEGVGVDLLTVSQRLRKMLRINEAGGDFYLMELCQKINSSAHIEYHSRILLQFYIKRQLIRESSLMLSKAYDHDKDSLELLQEWGAGLDTITEQSIHGKKIMSYSEGLDLVESRIEFLTHKDPEEVTGAYTGFRIIDLFTGGYQPGELIVEAARPGMGKTAKMLKCALANAINGNAVGIISAEMSSYQLIARTVAIDTDFHLKQITKTGFEKPEYFISLSKHKGRMRNYPIYIDDTASPDIRNVQATLRMWVRKYGIKIAIIDYLQLLSDYSKSGNREQEIASISRKLKGLAKELGIPIIALSQLSRAVEQRGSSKRPMLSDLRESGAIEQDADMVTFIYRPEYYGIEPDEEILALGANTEIIFAKYRGGAPGQTIGLYWQGDKTKFMDPAEYREQQQRLEHMERENGNSLPKPSAGEAFSGPMSANPDDDTPF